MERDGRRCVLTFNFFLIFPDAFEWSITSIIETKKENEITFRPEWGIFFLYLSRHVSTSLKENKEKNFFS